MPHGFPSWNDSIVFAIAKTAFILAINFSSPLEGCNPWWWCLIACIEFIIIIITYHHIPIIVIYLHCVQILLANFINLQSTHVLKRKGIFL